MPLSRSSNSLLQLNHRHVINSASTNSELIAAIKGEKLSSSQPHLLTADTQSQGRGQHGRSWQSPAGNVYLSLYHPITIPVSGLLSLIVGVELAKMPVIQALNAQLIEKKLAPIGVKWANDLGFYKTIPASQKSVNTNDDSNANNTDSDQIIYFNKLAGILIEPVWLSGKLVGIVIGVGLNVKTTPTLTAQTLEGMSYQAMSLQDINQMLTEKTPDNQPASLPELYEQISQALIKALSGFKQIAKERSDARAVNLTNTSDTFMQQFDTLDALAGLRLRVSQDHNGETQIITGHACGIDKNGCLQLRQDNGKLATLFTGRIDVIYANG